jgi:hypothetical protein
MKKKQTNDVFGMSNVVLPDTYVNRGELDERLSRLLTRPTHIALRGPSKCGKSWLRQKVVTNGLVVQCRFGFTSADVFASALGILGIRFEIDKTSTVAVQGAIDAQVEAGLALIAKANAKLQLNVESSGALVTTTVPVGRNIQDLRYIAMLLIESERRLVVEDVHYLSSSERTRLAYDLKALWDYGCFVMVVGVWGDANFFVRLNSELSGRIEEISVEWSNSDLQKIIDQGESTLNVQVTQAIKSRTVTDAYGNAGLLQRLMLQTLDEAKLFEQQALRTSVGGGDEYGAAAMQVAEQLNGVYIGFADRVASGIRTRSEKTAIYAHAMAVIMDASDEQHMSGISVEHIFERARARQPRIQKSNLKSILAKIDGLQVDRDGRGLVVTYDSQEECVRNVDRQLLFFRKYRTVSWPWEQLIAEADDK